MEKKVWDYSQIGMSLANVTWGTPPSCVVTEVLFSTSLSYGKGSLSPPLFMAEVLSHPPVLVAETFSSSHPCD